MERVQPVLSIVIAAYNTEKYIKKCIESIVLQCEDIDEMIEVVIVNDGSTDNTRRIISEIIQEQRLSYIKIIDVDNGGPARARHIGVKETSGKYFMFLDSDDFLQNGIIKKIIADVSENDVDCCFWGFRSFDEKTKAFFEEYDEFYRYLTTPINGKQAFIAKIERKMWICTGNACYRKALYEKVKLDDCNLKYGEDFLFIMQMLLLCEKVINIPMIGLNITIRENSLMRSGFQDYHMGVFTALDVLDNYIDGLYDGAEAKQLKSYLKAEYETQRLSIAKLIISSNIQLNSRALKKKCRIIPIYLKVNYQKIKLAKAFESIVFNHFFSVYVIICKIVFIMRVRR